MDEVLFPKYVVLPNVLFVIELVPIPTFPDVAIVPILVRLREASITTVEPT